MSKNYEKVLEETTDEALLQTYSYVKSMNKEGIKAEFERRGAKINRIMLSIAVSGIKKKLKSMENELDKRGLKYD